MCIYCCSRQQYITNQGGTTPSMGESERVVGRARRGAFTTMEPFTVPPAPIPNIHTSSFICTHIRIYSCIVKKEPGAPSQLDVSSNDQEGEVSHFTSTYDGFHPSSCPASHLVGRELSKFERDFDRNSKFSLF